MAFNTRPSVNPRASVFSALGHSGGSSNYVPAAQACVLQAQRCSDTLDASLEELEAGTKDMERLIKILHNSRLYVLIDEPTLTQIKSEVVESIEPQVEKLISQGEKAIANLERANASLQKRIDSAKTRAFAPGGDPHAAAPLQVRNEIRKTKLLVQQEKTLEKELASLQQEIDDLELQIMSASSGQRSRLAEKRAAQASRKR